MRAVVITVPGGPEVLEIREVVTVVRGSVNHFAGPGKLFTNSTVKSGNDSTI